MVAARGKNRRIRPVQGGKKGEKETSPTSFGLREITEGSVGDIQWQTELKKKGTDAI